jgi:mRNA interferase MazF
MNPTRGDIVLLDMPFSGGTGSKVRPALVVQNDRDNRRLTNTIVVMVTTQARRAGTESTQFLIELNTPEGRQSGLLRDSVVNCANVFTVDQRQLIRRLGSLPSVLMVRANECLKAALELT